MEFSVIYSFDCSPDASVELFNPPNSQRRKLWQLTENKNLEDWTDWKGKPGKHRKWCAILNREQFEAFLRHCSLVPEDVRTMGSIGAPGCGYGLSPAYYFRGYADDAYQSAYVTPLGTRNELITFLQDYYEDQHVPGVLTDQEGQEYLFPIDGEWEAVDDLIRGAMVGTFSDL